MAIAVIIDLKITLKQYDDLMDQVEDQLADKSLMHFAHKHGDGVRLIEIWPGQKELDEFGAIVMPLAKAAGIESTFEVIPVHRHFHKHHPHK